jgi:ABC-type proline/glycine betaine transport system substrate-binding protein
MLTQKNKGIKIEGNQPKGVAKQWITKNEKD